MEYKEFIENKKHSIGNSGFECNYIPDIAFDFQKFVIEKAILKNANASIAYIDAGWGDGSHTGSTSINFIEFSQVSTATGAPYSVLKILGIN